MTNEEREAWERGYAAANYDEQRWFKLGKECGKIRGEAIGFIVGVFTAVIVYCLIGA